MNRILIIVSFLFLVNGGYAQLVDVQADYNGNGDCVFSANNNAQTPLFLKIDFADLQNTSFNEPLPYLKKLTPGFNSLFTLNRDLDADVPRFNYQMKTYRSDPTAIVDLDFPYLIPLKPDTKVNAIDIKSIKGFWGDKEPDSWIATGFVVNAGDEVFAARQGEVVEIVGNTRNDNQQSWYNTWLNTVTLLQPDGTLVCYHNITAKNLALNMKVHAGQKLGEITSSSELVVLIYQNSLSSDELRFIIPQFAINDNDVELINVAKEYKVTHPVKVRALEMTKKEKRKILGLKR